MAGKLKKLKFSRTSCVSALQSLLALGIRAQTDRTVHSLFKVRFAEIDDIREEFLKHHNGIVSILLDDDEADLAPENTIQDGFHNDFYAIKTIYVDLFETNAAPERVEDTPAVSTNAPASNARLPKIELPKFKGDYKQFVTFLDLFNALVHSSSLSEIEKFNYLIASLEGPPLSLVRTLPMTSDNYTVAYNTLVERYSNTRLLAQEHWQAIENAQKINSDTPNALRRLLDIFSENLAALNNLKFPVEQWDFVLVMMLLKRLDNETVTKFELEHSSKDVPSYATLTTFLNRYCTALNTLSLSSSLNNSRKPATSRPSFGPTRTNSFLASKNNPHTCFFCKKNHIIYNCPGFLAKTPHERFMYAKNASLCLNCLSSVHDTRNCNSPRSCRHCENRHHSHLHFGKTSSPTTFKSRGDQSHPPLSGNLRPQGPLNSFPTDQLPSDNVQPSPSNQIFNASGMISKGQGTLLSTALVDVMSHQGSYHKLRCLFDTGSMTSFITQKAASCLGLPKTECLYEIQGLSGMHFNATKGMVTLVVRPPGKLSPVLTTDAVVINKICDHLPTSAVSIGSSSFIHNLKLADPNFNIPGPIDILLGADLFPEIILDGNISGKDKEPSAINTVFGYILMGKTGNNKSRTLTSYFCKAHEVNLDNTLRSFWELENVPAAKTISTEDKACEKLFTETVARNEDGKYIVSLPFKTAILPQFPGMRDLAVNRFLALERRLIKNQPVYQQYVDFMKEYLTLHHMEKISEYSLSPWTYYIPHHAILKPSSLTTKLRVVFNGSAKLPNQPSLNDFLHVGPKLQQDIVTILLTFRVHNFVLCADIQMMYRNILVDPAHCDYQRIVWRSSPNEPLQDYRLTTVVYGLKPSPYLALRTLHQLVQDEGQAYPLASNAILNHTYVDDVVTGSSSLDEANALKDELIDLCSKAGFTLRKWSSNNPSLLKGLPPEYLSQAPINFASEDSELLKVLGLQWNPQRDCFLFSVSPMDRPCTKRNMLSELARVFDPLGFLAPITFFTKNLIQQLWYLGLKWDQQPPAEITAVWAKYKHELPLLANLEIPRNLFDACDKTSSIFELHGFCDASEKGYAAVIFLRVIEGSAVSTRFITAKTKVAPSKKLTIPRLELCAAVLLSKLLAYILPVYNMIRFRSINAWSDSQIALTWITSSPHRWKTFVANRVAYIQENLSPSCWRYISSSQNPADCASRGLFPSELLSQDVWFHGPSFLLDSNETWNTSCPQPICDTDIQDEEKKVACVAKTEVPNFLDYLMSKLSSFNVLLRTLSYILRFIYNAKNPLQKRLDFLSTDELNTALITLVKRTQSLSFESELSASAFSKPLRKLHAFLDSDGVLRVGGRLDYSNLPYAAKHPIILPRNSRLTTLIIEYYHKKHLHVGPRTLQFLISQKFWILSSKRAINSVISKCVTCWRVNPKPFQPPMGNLPLPRISQAKAFSHAGVDFAGPFSIIMSRYRGVRTCKAYVCLFVCFATKALHLELATDLSSETFLAALQRFVARRGRCSDLYSDCGTNFVGSYKELKAIMKNSAFKENIRWHFNPPSAPHFGGLWESGVKSVKSHLKRVLGEQILTYEEFYTMLTLIESVLNSRPLCPLTADLEDINALTPAHFLNMEPVSPLPSNDLTTIPLSRLSRWQLVQRMQQDFWLRWKREYLHTLQQRGKWLDSTQEPQIGSLVLIKNDNSPPCQWSLARITALSTGVDGIARVATLKTAAGTLLRPLVKLCPLPIA